MGLQQIFCVGTRGMHLFWYKIRLEFSVFLQRGGSMVGYAYHRLCDAGLKTIVFKNFKHVTLADVICGAIYIVTSPATKSKPADIHPLLTWYGSVQVLEFSVFLGGGRFQRSYTGSSTSVVTEDKMHLLGVDPSSNSSHSPTLLSIALALSCKDTTRDSDAIV